MVYISPVVRIFKFMLGMVAAKITIRNKMELFVGPPDKASSAISHTKVLLNKIHALQIAMTCPPRFS